MTTLITQATIQPTLFNTLATLTGTQNISNKTIKTTKESLSVVNSSATGVLYFDVATQAISVYNTATANFSLVVRVDSSTNLASALAVGESIGITLLVPNAATPYYLTTITIDGAVQTPKYQSGIAFAAGNANSVDMYNIFIMRTGTVSANVGTYQIYASQTKFA
jgi:hypothetical protein